MEFHQGSCRSAVAAENSPALVLSTSLSPPTVPMRALALYGRKSTLTRLLLKDRFERELVVVTRKHRKQPAHITQFVENILF